MFAIRRSCAATLRSSTAPNGTRAFSRSAACHRGGLPVFVAPSSPELSTLLATFNSKILLPAHLTRDQQKLVFSKDGHAKLNTEPVDVTIGDVKLPLEPIDRNHLPGRFETLRDIIAGSSTRDDWENVMRAIEGFESAGIPVRPQWQEMVIRKLAECDMHSLILKALQRPKATTMRLSNHGLLRSVLRAVHDRAARNPTATDSVAAWGKDETAAALRLATQIVELMEDPEHHSVKPANAMVPHKDLRGRPTVAALPTELAAILAERHGADSEPVKTFSARLLATLEQSEFTTEIDRIAAADWTAPVSKTALVDSLTAHCHDLVELVIIWNALATSRRVLGANMPHADVAVQYETRLERVLTEAVAKAKKATVYNGTQLKIRYPAYVEHSIKVCRPVKA